MNTGLEKTQLVVNAGKWVQQGVTLAHHPESGKSIFVHGAIPGEKIKIQVTKTRSSHLFATVVDVIEPSELRLPDFCKVFPECGGCSFQHLTYDEEKKIKLKLLSEWKSISACMKQVEWNFFTENPEAYRNHVQVQNISKKWGFFALHSNKIVEFPDLGCMLISKEMNEVIKNTIVKKNGKYSFRQIEGKACLVDSNYTITHSIKLENASIFNWKFPSRGFFQVNRFLMPKWAKRIIMYFENSNTQHAIELFCGSALLGGLISENLKSYIGFDNDERSLSFAKLNFKKLKCKNKFVKLNLYDRLPIFQPEQDLCIANPPRSGLKKELIEKIEKSSIQTLIYSSCNPATLDRDLKLLLESGFKIKHLDLFDFFPRTWHLEILVIMERHNA